MLLILRIACGRKSVLSYSQKHQGNKAIVISAWILKDAIAILSLLYRDLFISIRFLIVPNQSRIQLIVCLLKTPFLYKSRLKYYFNMFPLLMFTFLSSHVS